MWQVEDGNGRWWGLLLVAETSIPRRLALHVRLQEEAADTGATVPGASLQLWPLG